MATVFNMNVLQGSSAGDVSLDSILVMAQAQGDEDGDSGSGRYVLYTDETECDLPGQGNRKGMRFVCIFVEDAPENASGCSTPGSSECI
ncbi:hypothetical protein [Natronoflexus pectinivorans]|uniref:hypothetical protein n=1 Tax=Natronoflexus pectinivorans TaxID=682526 RepID=UPI00104C1BCF|nr:hypothetical protein [Natronoflexus pectinivorans]